MNDIAVPVTMVDKFSGAVAGAMRGGLSAVRGFVSGTSSLLTGVAAQWFSINGAVNLFTKALGEAREGRQSLLQVKNALRMVNEEAREKDVVRWIEQFSDAMNVDADPYKQAFAAIATGAEASSEQVKALLPGIRGLETQGASVQEAVQGVINILQGLPDKSLRKYNIRVDAELPPEERFAALVQQLERFEEAGVKAATSGVAEIDGMRAAWDDVLEGMGTAFYETVAGDETVVKNFGETFRQFGVIAGGATRVAAGAFHGFVGVINSVSAALARVVQWVVSVQTIVVDAVAMAIAAVTKGMSGIKQAFGGLQMWLMGSILRVVEWMTDKITAGINGVIKAYNFVVSKIGKDNWTVKELAGPSKTGVGKALMDEGAGQMRDGMARSMRDAVQAARAEWNTGLTKGISDVGDAVANELNSKAQAAFERMLGGAHGENAAMPDKAAPDAYKGTEFERERRAQLQAEREKAAAAKDAAAALRQAADQLKEKVQGRLDDIRGAREKTATAGTKRQLERIDEDIDKAKARGDYKRVEELQGKRDRTLGMDKFKKAAARYVDENNPAEEDGDGAGGDKSRSSSNRKGKAGDKKVKNIEESEKSLAGIDKQMDGVARRLKSIERKVDNMAKGK